MPSFLQTLISFLQRKHKPGPGVFPRTHYPSPSPAPNNAAQRSPPRISCADPHGDKPSPVEKAPAADKAEEKVDVVALVDQVSNTLAPLLEQLKQELTAQIAQQVNQIQPNIENGLMVHDEKIAAELGRKLEKQVRAVWAQLERQITEHADRAVASARKEAQGHWSNLKRDMMESCSVTAQRATLRPVIDQSLALFDRINVEEAFLAAWYRKNPDLALNLGSRQLQERYDAAIRSFAAEILMILKPLGVELIVGSAGPLDPHRQHVIEVENTTQPELNGHIARIVRAGFLWNGTLYRPELVIAYKETKK